MLGHASAIELWEENRVEKASACKFGRLPLEEKAVTARE
jgi:hypothetical protein